MSDKMNICLIGGTGRSGTTILKKIFSKHPDVAKIPEWRFTIDPDGIIDFYNTCSEGWSPYQFDLKLKRLEMLLKDTGKKNEFWNLYRLALKKLNIQNISLRNLIPRYSDFSIRNECPQYAKLVNELISNLKEFDFKGHWTGNRFLENRSIQYAPPLHKEAVANILGHFVSRVIQKTLEKQKKHFYVEDNTWNILYFDKFVELLPDAKLVHIYRDPRDVISSFMKQTWAPTDPIQAAHFYNGIMDQWWRVHSRLPKNTFMEISLENLVQSSEPILKKICQFWNIEWHDALLMTDLSRSHSGRWKKDIPDKDKGQVHSILSETIQNLGYTL